MGKILTSEILSLIYIKGCRIATGDNKLTDEEFAELEKTNEFKTLKTDGRFIVRDETGEAESVKDGIEVGDMTLAQLKAYGKEIGLTGISNKTKEEILETIAEIQG